MRASAFAFGCSLLASSCVLAVGNKGAGGAAHDGENGAELSDEQAEIASAERDVEAAKLDLELAQRKGEHGVAEQREEVAQKVAARDAAQAELRSFRDMERPHKLTDADLEIEEARNNVWESEQELAELQSMYSKEQFAERAKELVLGRGEKHLALAKRRLELALAERQALEHGELAQKDAELAEELRKAGTEHELAVHALATAEFEAKADVEKAKFELASKQHALAKAKAEAKKSGA